MEKRVADLERRWTEMESKIAETSVTATAALRAEAKDDLKNDGEAVADLKNEDLALTGYPNEPGRRRLAPPTVRSQTTS